MVFPSASLLELMAFSTCKLLMARLFPFCPFSPGRTAGFVERKALHMLLQPETHSMRRVGAIGRLTDRENRA